MEYLEKPAGKPIEKIPGRLLKYENSDYVAFEPRQKKEQPTRTMLLEKKGCQYYRNEGEKDNSYSLHVNVNGNETDPAGALLQKAEDVLLKLTKKEPKAPSVKFITNTDELKIWQRKKEKKVVCMMMLDISKVTSNMSSKLLSLTAEINKVINSTKF